MRSTLRIGIVSAAMSLDPREAVARSRQAGFAGILFDAYSPHLSLPELSQSGRREFRGVLSGQDQELIGLRADVEGKGFSPSTDIDRSLSRVDRALEAAAGLTSPLVCVDLGPLPEPARAEPPKRPVDPREAGLILLPTPEEIAAARMPLPPPPKPVEADTPFESSVDAAMSELGRRADRYSVIVAFRSDLSSFAALDRALRKADCPWFGVDLDPVAVLRDHWGTDEVFSRLGGLVRHVRSRDASVGHDHRTRPAAIGHGDVDWGQLAALLDEAGYNGWLTIDPLELSDRQAAAREGLEQLREVVG
jgi:sugar phosphate isomerase/epimerase